LYTTSILPTTNEDLIAFDLYVEGLHPIAARVGAYAGADVKSKMMTATDDFVTFDVPLIQRLILVRAEAEACVILPGTEAIQNVVFIGGYSDLLCFAGS